MNLTVSANSRAPLSTSRPWIECPACQRPTTRPTGNIRTLEKIIMIQFRCSSCNHRNELQICDREAPETGTRIEWMHHISQPQ